MERIEKALKHGITSFLELNKGNVEIPESIQINGKEIVFNALQDNHIGYDLGYIHDFGAFENCMHLTGIKFPKTIKTIGDRTFAYCCNLKEIEIPAHITQVSSSDCNGITDDEYYYYEEYRKALFAECNNLTSIKVSSDNPVYDSRKNCNAIIETKTNILVAGCKNTKIPNDIVAISDSAFNECEKLTNIELPSSIIAIGSGAFRECRGLSSITIPSSVIHIGEEVFKGCTSLSEVNWESPIRPTKTMLENIFFACPNLQSINYHGVKIELKSTNLDKVIDDAHTPTANEPIASLDDVIKTAGNGR